jgi:hypothetical protein
MKNIVINLFKILYAHSYLRIETELYGTLYFIPNPTFFFVTLRKENILKIPTTYEVLHKMYAHVNLNKSYYRMYNEKERT